MKELFVLKIGGETLDSPDSLEQALMAIANSNKNVVLVHGGGRKVDALAKKLGVSQQMVEGRRITSPETLELCTMVYAGLINKNTVAKLSSYGSLALGVSGADLGLIRSRKRENKHLDYGLVGDVTSVNSKVLIGLLNQGICPVVCSLTLGEDYQLLNTNADTLAAEIAIELSKHYTVRLAYGFEKPGVLLDVSNPDSWLCDLTKQDFETLKKSGHIADGMVPKLQTAFAALYKGVEKASVVPSHGLGEFLNSKEVGTHLKLL